MGHGTHRVDEEAKAGATESRPKRTKRVADGMPGTMGVVSQHSARFGLPKVCRAFVFLQAVRVNQSVRTAHETVV